MSKHKDSEIQFLASLMTGDPITEQAGDERLLCEDEKSTIGYSNEPKENEVWVMKPHAGNPMRHLVMKGTRAGGLLGHVDRIPNVNLSDMSTDPEKDGHHAYAVKYRKGKHGIIKGVTHRLGEFSTHDDAVAAIKKFHKVD